ncbi:MAG: homocysteine S-methyltransferase family protein [Bacteroidales bacterium]|nr:homocysteine S-methyltransferase family protein [Bacteroidales bacterium]
MNNDRILILDGAMGTMIQRYGLTEADYRGEVFGSISKELRGNNECLNLTRPEIIREIHREYIKAGADIIESNTFSANRISQAEYGCGDYAAQMAYEGARIARSAADEAASEGRKVWVAGSMGPTSKSLSLSPDVSDPAFRAYSFDQMCQAYREQAEAMIQGGADLILIETCFDALNVKAALYAISTIQTDRLMVPQAHSKLGLTPARGWESVPVIVSVSVGDRSGRTLTGQTLEAFYTSVKHYPLLAFGLNCSLGAAEMAPLLEDVAGWCECLVSCYPNAGLPNEMGGYDQTPSQMAEAVVGLAQKGLVDIVGGCCGTTPEHIAAIAKAVSGLPPYHLSGNSCLFTDDGSKKGVPSGNMGCFTDESQKTGVLSGNKGSSTDRSLTVSGLEAVGVDLRKNNFTNVGERTNVAGSRKFARLIAAGEYDQALQIAAKQIEDGATIIDINMDDAMLDSTREMERFVRCISNDPAVAKAALMIDSSHWETILAGLKNAQGKCIVNSISLKEGPEAFVAKAREIRELGAAMVVMAFDEQGQATTYDRKIEICERAYRLLTQEAGVPPEDIIFDVNILSIGTGIEEHARYAVDFIEAVRWIKTNLPGALTSGGVSNLSFAFRGNNVVREAMHSAFLYHAIKAGLDMAIVNPSMLQVYDEIEPQLLQCVEDVIFDRDPQATERLIDKASEMLARKEAGAGSTSEVKVETVRPVGERLRDAVLKGRSETLMEDIPEAIKIYGEAVSVIEGPLMEGMESVGRMFGEGKMFLPQVVKAAKVMRDAVDLLQPFMQVGATESVMTGKKEVVVIATVKGDVHDIGKNILGIVLTCNGFEVHDLGVMVDKETILSEAERLGADIIGVSGLITPSLYQMEELCREMASRGMTTPLFIGGATTSALHTAVKLAPLYDHVFYGPDASASAVLAKRCMMDREVFEKEEHLKQEKIREMYMKNEKAVEQNICATGDTHAETATNSLSVEKGSNEARFGYETYLTDCPEDIPAQEIPAEEVLPYFDWKMFYAIWGVKYGSAVPEAAELMQLRRDAEEELRFGDYRIMLAARFMEGCSDGEFIVSEDAELPMLRQEGFKKLSLSDFVIPEESGRKSPFGVFAISVNKRSKAHVEGCSCPACNSRYEDMIGRTVRQTIAEAASKWLSDRITKELNAEGIKIIKPAAGYSSCPDHTLKIDILKLLGETELGIRLTESCAMTPEASICGMIFMHPEACYPEIRNISQEQYEKYRSRRNMDAETARRFLGHLLK